MASITAGQVVTYTQDFVCDAGESAVLTQFATELKDVDLPLFPNPWIATFALIAATADTAAYTVATTRRKLEAVFYGGYALSYEDWAAFETQAQQWRDLRGAPRYWTVAHEQDRNFRVHPTPAATSAGANSVITETDRFIVMGPAAGTSLPYYLRLPAMLWVVSREYSRESNHRDIPFATACRELAERFFNMIDGIVPAPKKAKANG